MRDEGRERDVTNPYILSREGDKWRGRWKRPNHALEPCACVIATEGFSVVTLFFFRSFPPSKREKMMMNSLYDFNVELNQLGHPSRSTLAGLRWKVSVLSGSLRLFLFFSQLLLDYLPVNSFVFQLPRRGHTPWTPHTFFFSFLGL